MTLKTLKSLSNKWRGTLVRRNDITPWKKGRAFGRNECADDLDKAIQSIPSLELDNHHNAITCPYCNPNDNLVRKSELKP